MPKAIVKGKVKHFPYTEKGMEEAKKAKKKGYRTTSDGKMRKVS